VDYLNPDSPFVWPEPRIHDGAFSYHDRPPLGDLACQARAVFGVLSAIMQDGVEALRTWLQRNDQLEAAIVVVVYPTCATDEISLAELLKLAQEHKGRLSVRVHRLDGVTDRASTALCFLSKNSDHVWVANGVTENLGLGRWNDAHLNTVSDAGPPLVAALRNSFDWIWHRSSDILIDGVRKIPRLVLPEGTPAGSQAWREYANSFGCDDGIAKSTQKVEVDPETGEVIPQPDTGESEESPTEEMGVPKPDPLTIRIAALYDKGSLVSIDKMGRLPPLDAPVDPRALGDIPELHKGSITRKVSMRVSVVDPDTLKQIEKRRKGLRPLLNKFSYALADSIRWIPNEARALFESELKRLNEEGQKVVAALLDGDVDAFLKTKRDSVAADIEAMYAELGGAGEAPREVVDTVVRSLRTRLKKAQSGSLLPGLSYSKIALDTTDGESVSPWEQAYTLLAEIASLPRKALTDPFFLRGMECPEEKFLQAMDVAGDKLSQASGFGMKSRCRADLGFLSQISESPVCARTKCELVLGLIDGREVPELNRALCSSEEKEMAS
jgi:hypothetical protein